jgi:hypothetical protein
MTKPPVAVGPGASRARVDVWGRDRRAKRSALFFDGRNVPVELLGLVVKVDRDLTKSCFVLTRVVRTKKQLATTGQHRA